MDKKTYEKLMDALNRLDELADNEETAKQNEKDYKLLADFIADNN